MELAEKSPKESTKEIILAYDVDKDEGDIYKAMNNHLKPKIIEAAEYLKIPVAKEMLKEDIIKSILSKINSTLLELCAKCNIYYSVDLDAEPIAKCACGQHCHYNCYKDIADVFKQYPGVVFQCSHCSNLPSNAKPKFISKQPPPDTSKNVVDHTKMSQPKPPVKGTESPTELKEQPTYKLKVVQSYNLDFLQARYQQQSFDICEKYKRFNCPHGRKGLEEIDGEICNKLHPKKCFKWTAAGKHETRGCNEGGDCQYYHPRLCNNSLRYKKCLKADCTFTHLQGTRRYDRSRRSRYHHQRHDDHPINYHNDFTQPSTNLTREDPVPKPWNSGRVDEVQPKPNAGATSESVDFLGKLIQSLSLEIQNVHKDLEEVKKSRDTKDKVSQQQMPPQYIIPQYMYNPNTQTMQLTKQPLLQQPLISTC